MTVSPLERRSLLSRLVRVGAEDLRTLWRYAATSDQDFPPFFREAFPELVIPLAVTAIDMAAAWYDETPSETDYIAVPGPLPIIEAIQRSVEWALGADGDKARDRLDGTLQRIVFNAYRDTITTNVGNESGARWARYASANACAFCAMLATRDVLYTSEEAATRVVGRGAEMTPADRRARAAGRSRVGGHTARGGQRPRGSRPLGEKYHDHCSCIAVEVRPGGIYTPPDYVSKWEEAYTDASREVQGTDMILAHMRQSLSTH